jgi:hypothetical protein
VEIKESTAFNRKKKLSSIWNIPIKGININKNVSHHHENFIEVS